MPDLHTAPAAYADEETVDTDFVHHLVRGADLLHAGDADKARSMLERALQLRPENERGRNLLALSYFKLGLYDRAEEIYRGLVAAHPTDPTLRVNLGLVLLKAGREDEAIVVFRAALDLAPDHRKAQNYVGLAYMQKGELALAKEWFEKAGNPPMVERMTLALANAPLRQVGDVALRLLDDRALPFSAPEATPVAAPGAWVATSPPTVPSPEPGLEAPTPELLAFSAASRLETVESAAAFGIGPAMVNVAVKGELFCRLDGLLATFGALELKPELKRFRGRVTDKAFGDGGKRMMRIEGTGRLWFAVAARHFQAVELGDEAAYFREDALFAFEESLLFENGRVPSRFSSDLQLVHLRGRGRALLVSRHRPRAVDVKKDEPCRVPLDVLLGWHGNVAPRIVAMGSEEGDDVLPAVEFSGEGRVLLDAAL